MTDDINRQIFREEAFELLAELETTLLELEAAPDDVGIVNRVFRTLHTIKGSGSMFGFDEIADFTHEVESMFDMVRNGDLSVSRALLDQSFAVRDHIQRMLAEGGGDEVDPEEAAAILEQLRRIAAGEELSAASAEQDSGADVQATAEEAAPGDEGPAAPADLEPEEDDLPKGAEATDGPQSVSSQDGGDSGEKAVKQRLFRVGIAPEIVGQGEAFHIEPLLDELRKLGRCDVLVDDSALPPLDQLDPQRLYLSWQVTLRTEHGAEDIKDIFFFSDASLRIDVDEITEEEAAAHSAGPDPDEGWELLDAAPDPAPAPSAPPVRPTSADKEAEIAADSDPAAPVAETDADSDAAAVPKPSSPPPAAKKPESKLRPEPGKAAAARPQEAVSSIRVAAEKLDSLVDLVGELVIVQAQITQLSQERDDPPLKRLAEDLERLSDELRDSALGVRMLPIGTSFSKFRRLVRDLSGEMGKEMELTTSGADTELDKTVIERLADPLVHLLRNSIDHGVEMPEERVAAGKPSKAMIRLSAEHSGGEVLIRIVDDGRGIDAEVIRAKALERGLITTETELSDADVFNLIFEPGFSTAKQVTSVSGRGVGMDVVKRAIDSLRGRIDINSSKGVGTEITIRLPLTLAIIDGLQVRVGEEFYVIPLAVVEECVELRAEDEADSDRRILYLRGEIVPYVQLREWFEITSVRPEIEQVVIVGLEGRRVGIVVDKVIGEHQTVIKSLGKVYKDVDGISGATIKGDGSIALILDVPGLMKRVIAESA